ncbi:GNAT family N-acetyltransferase [Desulfomonile tiedjei]|uniref:Acetyltransferase n=1 Tax=Desulfomonile tiedjei (strain ATCC 49306 / DSM 6799 / DCB-1) TaxID=706587 RepID=I4C803_DESTA|nr:GNAT family N-acetyltransferase [Desulfomonile tiedjei]AFM25694.1 acetyltransferase [Desulfomonile tiedjei DSM 6799]
MKLPADNDGFTYSHLDEKDLEDVAETMSLSFTDGSEPTARALGLAKEDFKQFSDAVLPKLLCQDLSFVARDSQSGEIAGTLLNEKMSLDLPVSPIQFPWSAPVIALAAHLYNIYYQRIAQSPPDSLHIFMLAIQGPFRGKGIGHQLLKLSLEHARSWGYSRAVVEATGLVSQHIFRKAGFFPCVEVPYARFECDGKRPFANTGEHPSIMLMDMDL